MNILFATDGSDSALAALDLLLRFPFPAHSEVRAITVIDRPDFPARLAGILSAALTDDEPVQTAEAQAAGTQAEDDRSDHRDETDQATHQSVQAHLALVSERLRAAGWSSSTEVRRGHPVDQICAAAEAWNADLVIVGSHGHTGIRRHILGSVSTGVLHYAHCSVLVIPHPDLVEQPTPSTEQALRVLLAHDASECADKALELCASLPAQGKMSFTVLRVLELVTLYRQDLHQQMSGAFQEEKRAAQEGLQRAAEKLRRAGSQVEIKLLEDSDPSRIILDTAAEQHSDLIVLGHKGRSAIKRMLVGSVVGRIATHTPCALLTVR